MFHILLVIQAVLFAPQAGANEETGPQAVWQDATLKMDGQTVKAGRVRDVWQFEKRIDNYLLRIEGNKLEVVDFASLEKKWTETERADHEWFYVGSESNVLYLMELKRDTDCLQVFKVRRRNLVTGEQLDDLPIPMDESEQGSDHQVVGALVMGSDLCLLTSEVKVSEQGELVACSYRVTKYSGAEQIWTQVCASAGSVKLPGAMILGTLGPGLDGASSQSIVLMGSQLLVSAGQKEDLLAMDVATGKVKWRIPRLWEYRRGFVGPSVWQYYLGRYGLEDSQVELADLTVEQLTEKNRKDKDSFYYNINSFKKLKKLVQAKRKEIASETCWVFAGPVVLSMADGESRIFVVTAQSRDSTWSNYLANAVIYEIDASGSVVSMNTLPRLVERNDFYVLDDRIAWRAEEAMVDLLPSRDRQSQTFTRFNCRQIEHPEIVRQAWLSQGSHTSRKHYAAPYLYSIEQGGWIESRNSKEFHFPIRRHDLKSGQSVEFEMLLPFNGVPDTPRTNYSYSSGQWTVYGSYLFSIEDIACDGQLLCVTMKHGQTRKLLEFKLPANTQPVGSAHPD